MEGFNAFMKTVTTFFNSGIGSVLLFLGTAIFGAILIKIITLCLRRIFNRSKLDRTLTHFTLEIIKFALWMIYVITLLTIVGVPITSLVAILTAIGLALSLAVQSSLSNLANGMVILANKPFREGDFIEIDGTGGTVISVKMLNTTLRTTTNEIITIPHNKTINAIVKNYSLEPKRRIDMTVSVAYGSDLDTVKNLLQELIDAHPLVLRDEPNLVRLSAHNSSSLDFVLRAWVNNPDYWDVYYDLKEQIVTAFRNNGIEIPFNQLDVNLKGTDKPSRLNNGNHPQ